MKLRTTFALLAAITISLSSIRLWAHCEIPCGIYGDRMRIDMIAEDITTVEKSMNQIEELGKAGDKNWNQLIRWVNNKELHANKIQETVYQYFMNQRITPVDDPEAEGYDKYIEQITLLHRMLVQAMKTKQTTDHQHIENLRSLLDQFSKSYFEDKEHDHGHHH